MICRDSSRRTYRFGELFVPKKKYDLLTILIMTGTILVCMAVILTLA
jgi:hypothetical protein